MAKKTDIEETSLFLLNKMVFEQYFILYPIQNFDIELLCWDLLSQA